MFLVYVKSKLNRNPEFVIKLNGMNRGAPKFLVHCTALQICVHDGLHFPGVKQSFTHEFS